MTTKQRSAKSSAKDVFSYLLMIIMLAVGTIFFTTLVWQYINIQLPDPLSFYYSSSANLIRSAISALVIVWPVLLLTTWMINKDLSSVKEKANIWIRKWLLYLTLFVASLTVIINLITLVNSFLGGELTTRFLLKTLTVLVVAASVFGFYLWELRRDVSKKTNVHKLVALATSILVAVWIVLGFMLIGSPQSQRALRFDEERVYDLQEIDSQIIYYYQSNESLPNDLEVLSAFQGVFMIPTDPETGAGYNYRVTGDLSYELCATFTLSSDENNDNVRSPYGQKSFWQHESGNVCFQKTINPDEYPIFPLVE